MFLWGAYKKPREATWISGVVLLLLTLAYGLSGYLLPWDNRAYWGTVVTTQIVGLAPGLRGANRTGRPFTGDFAGDLLYDTLKAFGFANGSYRASPQDGLTLVDARITNAVRCAPPENKPTPAEIGTCRPFLKATIAEMQDLRAVVTLGRISHASTLAALDQRRSAAPFGHGTCHDIGRLRIFVSYHCSRYNTNTGVLTPEMFRDVFAAARAFLDD